MERGNVVSRAPVAESEGAPRTGCPGIGQVRVWSAWGKGGKNRGRICGTGLGRAKERVAPEKHLWGHIIALKHLFLSNNPSDLHPRI